MAKDSPEPAKLTKPRRPLTCYNIFFRYERATLLGEEIDPRSIIEGMYSGDKRPRRAHRKSHGKISFKELADHVSTAWRTLAPDKKKIFHDLADEALQMYRQALEEYEHSLRSSAPSSGIIAGLNEDGVPIGHPSQPAQKSKSNRRKSPAIDFLSFDDPSAASSDKRNKVDEESGMPPLPMPMNMSSSFFQHKHLDLGTKMACAKPSMGEKQLDLLVNAWESIDPVPSSAMNNAEQQRLFVGSLGDIERLW